MTCNSFARNGFTSVALVFPAMGATAQVITGQGSPLMFWPMAAILLAVIAVIAFWVLQNRKPPAKDQWSAQQLDTVMNLASGGVVGVNAEKNIVMINDTGRRMLGGVSKAPPFAWPENIEFWDDTDETPLEGAKFPVDRALSNNHLKGETFLMSRAVRHNEARRVRITSAPMDASDGKLKALIVLEDISPMVATEKSEAMLGQQDVFSALAQSITHDYSNMLDTIAYAIDASLNQILPDKATSHLMTALTTVEKGRSLTRKVTLLARQQVGQVSSRSVMSMLEDFQILVPSVIDENVSLVVECREPGLLVRCNQAKLEDALLALVLNGCDAILRHADAGTVTISAQLADVSDSVLQLRELHSSQSEFVELIVSDDGPGMDPAIANQVSNPFVLSGSGGLGIGQGLIAVQSFVTEAGGHVHVEPNTPQGTSVHLVLPLERESLEVPANWNAPLPVGGGETVLVVEDDAMMLMMLQETLEELRYRVISATSGTAALGLLEQGVDFDLVITDIIMPGDVDGFDLVRQVKQLSESTGVLYISGYSEFLNADKGPYDAPILVKPCAANDLANAVKAVLSKRLV